MSATEKRRQSYDYSDQFNIYVSAAYPKHGTSGLLIGWGSDNMKQFNWKAQCSSRAEGQTAADIEAHRVAWRLMKSHLPREKKKRNRKQPVDTTGEPRRSERDRGDCLPSASSSGSVPPASSDGRRANGGHINSGRAAKAARSRGCGLGHGTPSAVSSLFQPAPAAAPSVQLAMLAKARADVHNMRLQLAQARSALEASEEVAARLRRDLAKLQQWAVSQAALEIDTLPSPHKLPELLGTGYTPTERLRTIWNHFHRAFDAVARITGGDHKKTAELFLYAAQRLDVAGSTRDENMVAVQTGIIKSLREFFATARERTGNSRPPRKLAQCVQAVLTAVAHAPELGGVSMAAVANELDLGARGVKKLSSRTDAADAFVFEKAYDGLFDDQSKLRSDAFTRDQIDWVVSECWLSDDFTRESEQKKHEVYDPKSRQKDREHHRLRWLELPLGEFYLRCKEKAAAKALQALIAHVPAPLAPTVPSPLLAGCSDFQVHTNPSPTCVHVTCALIPPCSPPPSLTFPLMRVCRQGGMALHRLNGP